MAFSVCDLVSRDPAIQEELEDEDSGGEEESAQPQELLPRVLDAHKGMTNSNSAGCLNDPFNDGQSPRRSLSALDDKCLEVAAADPMDLVDHDTKKEQGTSTLNKRIGDVEASNGGSDMDKALMGDLGSSSDSTIIRHQVPN